MTSLPQRWKQAREMRGLSMNELDRQIGQSSGFSTRVESGEKPGITMAIVAKAAEVLAVSLEWLVNGTGSATDGAALSQPKVTDDEARVVPQIRAVAEATKDSHGFTDQEVLAASGLARGFSGVQLTEKSALEWLFEARESGSRVARRFGELPPAVDLRTAQIGTGGGFSGKVRPRPAPTDDDEEPETKLNPRKTPPDTKPGGTGGKSKGKK